MKITTFNPHIITGDAEPVTELFEALGFERRHMKDVDELESNDIRMKDAGGFHIDISETDVLGGGDRVAIRMNVDDFDEAYRLLTERGFKNLYGRQIVETETSRSAMLMMPSGIAINLIYHKK